VTVDAPVRALGHTIHRLGEVVSTQIEAARQAANGASEGTVVTATHQSAGRGRRGRSWLDAPGQSLLMSIVLRPPIPPGLAPQLSLVAAVAVADALGLAGATAAIRWPNDVMVGKRKICGLLPEAVTTRAGALEHVILGIGLNVNQADFPEPIRELATSMRIETGGERAVDAMMATVLAALEDRYRRFVQAGLGALLPAWLERAQGIGGRATAADGREGIAVGLDLDGALLLRTDSGETMRVLAGEVMMEAFHAAGH
jgi:BirA family transcriptional regulator, biotin operon repressor / biotin---[acetyl-CoA-carboxylase] ligase